MPGQPQLREAAGLYGEDPDIPLATVRLEQRMDGSGVWVVLLNSPAEEQQPKRWERPDIESAREVLTAIYAEGESLGGRWRFTHRHGE